MACVWRVACGVWRAVGWGVCVVLRVHGRTSKPGSSSSGIESAPCTPLRAQDTAVSENSWTTMTDTLNKQLRDLAGNTTDEHTLVGELLDAGAEVDCCDATGVPPLHLACALNNYKIVEAFLARRSAGTANCINQKDQYGCTALIHAVHNGHRKVVQLLLDDTKMSTSLNVLTDISIQGPNGDTALTMAKKHGHKQIVEILEQALHKRAEAAARLAAAEAQKQAELAKATELERQRILREQQALEEQLAAETRAQENTLKQQLTAANETIKNGVTGTTESNFEALVKILSTCDAVLNPSIEFREFVKAFRQDLQKQKETLLLAKLEKEQAIIDQYSDAMVSKSIDRLEELIQNNHGVLHKESARVVAKSHDAELVLAEWKRREERVSDAITRALETHDLDALETAFQEFECLQGTSEAFLHSTEFQAGSTQRASWTAEKENLIVKLSNLGTNCQIFDAVQGIVASKSIAFTSKEITEQVNLAKDVVKGIAQKESRALERWVGKDLLPVFDPLFQKSLWDPNTCTDVATELSSLPALTLSQYAKAKDGLKTAASPAFNPDEDDIFDTLADEHGFAHSDAFLALAYVGMGPDFYDDAAQHEQNYFTHLRNLKEPFDETSVSPIVFLLGARCLARKLKYVDVAAVCVSIFKRLVAAPDDWLTEMDLKLLSDTEVEKVKRSLQTPRQLLKNDAKSKWERLQKNGAPGCEPIDRLMELIGLEPVKKIAIEVYERVRKYQFLPESMRVPITLNFSFLGNPGTGKTTVARIFGELLHATGARSKATFIEKTAADLNSEGASEFTKTVDEALGGVLFIDEAYALEPKHGGAGKGIVDKLLTAAENHRENLTIIVAGYKDDIENELYGYNIGMKSRFKDVTFDDFSLPELRQIWDLTLRKTKWAVDEDAVSVVTVRRIARGIGRKGFGNARDVRRTFENAVNAATSRCNIDNKDAPHPCLTKEDVIGPPPSRASLPELDAALGALEQYVGLGRVKDAINSLVELAKENYEREIKGEKPFEIALNRLFIGNPGTGKTSVASIYGKVLKSLRFLSDGTVEAKTASDFVGEAVGQSSNKTKAIIDNCAGKVLLVDEAYNLDDNMYGKQVLDTIVEKVMGSPGEDIAVVMCGYENEIMKMLRDQNPGLSRRFDPTNAFRFDDYEYNELTLIFKRTCRKEGVHVPTKVRKRAIRELAKRASLPNFGNAGAVKSMISSAKARAVARERKEARTNGSSRSDGALTFTIDDLLSDENSEEGGSRDPMDALQGLYGMEKICKEVEKMKINMEQQKRMNKETKFKNGYIFLGNPGTGKTTVARVMATILHALGVLPGDRVVETTASDLKGQFIGQAQQRVKDKMREAKGNVLFIDEAYELGLNQYGQEAMTQLLSEMTSPEHEKSTVVIMAGYKENMHDMLDRNSGMRSRFQAFWEFDDWSADDCKGCIVKKAMNDGFLLDTSGAASARLVEGFRDLKSRSGWANARDTIAVYDSMLEEQALRTYDTPEAVPTLKFEDADKALVALLRHRPKIGESRGAAIRAAAVIDGIRTDTGPVIPRPILLENIVESEHPGDSSEPEEGALHEETIADAAQERLDTLSALLQMPDLQGMVIGSNKALFESGGADGDGADELMKALMAQVENIHNADDRKRAENLIEEMMEERKRAYAAFLKAEEERIERERIEEEARLAELARIQEEEERRERQRQMEEEARREREKEKKRQEYLQMNGSCCAGYPWIARGGGRYQCSAGGHSCTVPSNYM